MKLRCVFLPIIIFALFGYGFLKLNEASQNDTIPVTGKALKAAVAEDIQDVKNVIHKEAK
jgi:hypothetical protein